MDTSIIFKFPDIVLNNRICLKIICLVAFLIMSYIFANISNSMVSQYLRFDFVIIEHSKTDLASFVFPQVIICSELFQNLGLIKYLIRCEFNEVPCNYTHFEDIEMYDPFYDYFAICNKFNELKSGKQGIGAGLKIQLVLQSDGDSIDKVLVYIAEQGIRPFFENNDLICKGGDSNKCRNANRKGKKTQLSL